MVSEIIFYHLILEPPTLNLEFRDRLLVRVGQPCTLQGYYTGKPTPTIKWFKNDEELQANDEIMLTSTKKTLCLSIEKAKRDHSGKYTVAVENSIGIQRGICTVTVVGEFWISGFTRQIFISYNGQSNPFFKFCVCLCVNIFRSTTASRGPCYF